MMIEQGVWNCGVNEGCGVEAEPSWYLFIREVLRTTQGIMHKKNNKEFVQKWKFLLIKNGFNKF